ncbi:MAG: alkaline phosphatase family protein [Bradyrhizobium sp.]|uniref:alkaline phosphatase family protein n=1 Tax=Bradyrhizobium sp. TaxID=376 RepID=UPI001C299661|nr:alkaline phosphatase family protein [Bradyrhizobium sp.]MBU6463115.1 alkaline phosphatase family protein [Pseudomonadota bacterium]MDE2068315.1 alkaline phosphatase family protein [Bradyrhizobium sp.]
MRGFRDYFFSTAAVVAMLAGGITVARADDDNGHSQRHGYKHVLLISVDGMHAIDLKRWVESRPGGNFAQLTNNGVVYPNAYTTAPSDSYPGMLAQVTGATPQGGGLFYDDSYDWTEYHAKDFYTSQGLADPGCVGAAGTELTNFEALDKTYNYSTALVADYTGGGTVGQVYTQLDPDHMQRKLVNGQCVPVYPHEYVRTNTIFEIIKAAGMGTAWSDKHPAYENLAGPSGKGLDELFAPEINSQDTLDAGAQTGDDYTTSYTGVRTYDSMKVKAVLNWIDGYNGARTQQQTVPAIFGMNFQAVSVGQKLAKAGNADTDKSLVGGYADAQATPGNALTLQFQFVDDALGKFISELKAKNLYDSTLIIVSAKHGQSPINVKDRVAISDAAYSKAPGFGTNGFEICDDEALVWLSPEMQQATNPATENPYYADAKAYILAHAADLHIQKLLDRDELTKLYEDPFHNSRVPDFIAITDHGVICTGGSKLAEHGGFSDDDRNVLLVVSSPRIKHAKVVEDTTFTTQIAPTILDALDLDPRSLQAVREEGTQVLK